MSVWIRALCTCSARVSPGDLRASIAARLPALAAMYGEEGAEEAAARLAVEDAAPRRPFTAWSVDYRGDGTSLRLAREAAREEVREQTQALAERLEDNDEDEVDDVRALLGDVVEILAIELPMRDVEGIGWAVAIAAAACFAERGEGLVQADGEGYLAPRGRGVEQVLDGD